MVKNKSYLESQKHFKGENFFTEEVNSSTEIKKPFPP